MSHVEIVKIEQKGLFKDGFDKRVFFENGKFVVKSWIEKQTIFSNDGVPDDFRLSINVFFKLGNTVFERKYWDDSTRVPVRKENVKKVVDHKDNTSYYQRKITHFLIDKDDVVRVLKNLMIKETEKFRITESELIGACQNIMKNEFVVEKFKTQVKINDCIIDGIAFIRNDSSKKWYKIIGFEAKTNCDTYDRLYNQINNYLCICDEVYLVVEDKVVPGDLPFYVGVIKVLNGVGKIVRRAHTLHHSPSHKLFWKTLLKGVNTHVGIKQKADLINLFDTFEEIKRKLLWNQFVIGFREKYDEDYMPLTEGEKSLLQNYYKQGVIQ